MARSVRRVSGWVLALARSSGPGRTLRSPFAALGGSKRALLPLVASRVASRVASDARTLAQEGEAADIDAQTILTQADEALAPG